jgi:LysR family glycine cleavage system transcriptional activator
MSTTMRLRLPPLNALKAFEATARLGSFKAAADELLVSPGAVSRHIVNLESYLGLALFWRRHNENGLTATGEAYAEQVLRAMTLIEHESRRMMQIANPKQLHIRAGPTFAHCWLAPRLSRFCAANDRVDLLLTTNIGEIDSTDDHYDIAIHMMRDPSLIGEHELLFESEIIPVCHQDYLKQCGGVENPQDLAKCTLLHSVNRMTYWRQWFQGIGLSEGSFETGPKFSSSVLAYKAAKGNSGFACAEPCFVQDALDSGELVAPFDLRAQPHDGFYLTIDPIKADRDAVRAFRDWILEETEVVRTQVRARRSAAAASANLSL